MIHQATNPIIPAPGLVSFRLWDGWHNPTCILGQITTIGRLTMIDTLRMENADVEMLIKAKINPMLESPKWKGVARGWRDIGDISMRTPDQSNISRSAAKVIEEQLDTHFEGGPKMWEHLVAGMKRGLSMMIHGMPAVLVCPTNIVLNKTLSGGWHYKTDNSGNITSKLPEKDELSHVGDAFANGVSVLLPAHEVGRHAAKYKMAAAAARERAATYAGN